MKFHSYLELARIDHWIKNGFMLPGIFIAYLFDKTAVFNMMQILIIAIGFLSVCLIASANYILNEYLDAEFDRFHPIKKNRSMVINQLKKPYVMTEYLLFALCGLILSWWINRYFFLMALWLLVMGFLYNVKPFRTKDLPFLDVLTESINNIIRFLLGWFLITVIYLPPSSILFGYWMAGAFLMSAKRFAEFRMIDDPELAGKYRKSFKYYTENILLFTSFFYAVTAMFVLGIFLIKYRSEYLICIPLLFCMFSYYFVMSFGKNSVVQTPEKLFRQKKLMALVIIFIITIAIGTFVDIPVLERLYDSNLPTLSPVWSWSVNE